MSATESTEAGQGIHTKPATSSDARGFESERSDTEQIGQTDKLDSRRMGEHRTGDLLRVFFACLIVIRQNNDMLTCQGVAVLVAPVAGAAGIARGW